jgi:CheY-like chemotaxis protein
LLNSPYHLIEPLITDNDQPIHRQLLMKLLAPLGFEIKEASNGKDAIAALEPFASRVRSTQAIVLVRGTPFNMDRRRKNILNLREKVILPRRSC